ncbi:MAG: DUF3086 domain-containing protein [Cyanobacteria bacterium J06631_2]
MNSENSSIPESDNNIFESVSSNDTSQDNGQPTDAASDVLEDACPQDKTRELSLPETDSAIKVPEFELSVSTPEEESDTATLPENIGVGDQETKAPEDSSKGESANESTAEPDLFVDTWLEESDTASKQNEVQTEISQLAEQKAGLEREISQLEIHKEQLLQLQMREAQASMNRLIEEGTQELRERKTALRVEIEKLERRKERINQEMRSNFAGSSKELAIRVQGFKEYLVGSLQDLATAADKLELARPEAPPARRREEARPSRRGEEETTRRGNRTRRREESGRARGDNERSNRSQFSEPTFADQSRRIRQLLDKYCNNPDYYGAPWQLRRTFDQNQAKKVQGWFFTQGGRGAIDSTGSRLQNILLASAAISILHELNRDRTQVLILTDTPENLGEWRKGLEDCLGISRRDFGTNRGVVLFDSPEVLVQRAERLIADKLLPIIIIDETEEQLNLSMLKFPLWLAFASTNKSASTNYLY